MIIVAVSTTFASCLQPEILTENAAGKEVSFQYSSDWDDLAKLVVFDDGVVGSSVLDTDGFVTIPGEVLTTRGRTLSLYVRGLNASGTPVITTTRVALGKIFGA